MVLKLFIIFCISGNKSKVKVSNHIAEIEAEAFDSSTLLY